MQSLVEDLLDMVKSPDFIAIAVLCLLLGLRGARLPWGMLEHWHGQARPVVVELAR